MFLITRDRNITKMGLHGVNIAQYLGISQNLKRRNIETRWPPGTLGSGNKDKTGRISLFSHLYSVCLCLALSSPTSDEPSSSGGHRGSQKFLGSSSLFIVRKIQRKDPSEPVWVTRPALDQSLWLKKYRVMWWDQSERHGHSSRGWCLLPEKKTYMCDKVSF